MNEYDSNRILDLTKKINLYGFKNLDLGQFSLKNIELLIKKN